MKSFGYITMRTKASNSSPSKFSMYRNLLHSIMIVTARRPKQMYKYYTELSLRSTVILRKTVTLGQYISCDYGTRIFNLVFTKARIHSQMTPVYIFPILFSIHFNIILLSKLRGNAITALILNIGNSRRWEVRKNNLMFFWQSMIGY
jgi:hypothetical protein